MAIRIFFVTNGIERSLTISYHKFAEATLQDMFSEDDLAKAEQFISYTFETSIVENLGGNKFKTTERSQIEKDLKYYEARMSPEGPAMGNSVLATLYSRLGNPEKAYELFIKTYKPNEIPPFGVLAETAGGTNPYFATGAGGMLQAVIFGFGGLNITNEGIRQDTRALPKKWKSLQIKGVGPEQKDFIIK